MSAIDEDKTIIRGYLRELQTQLNLKHLDLSFFEQIVFIFYPSFTHFFFCLNLSFCFFYGRSWNLKVINCTNHSIFFSQFRTQHQKNVRNCVKRVFVHTKKTFIGNEYFKIIKKVYNLTVIYLGKEYLFAIIIKK